MGETHAIKIGGTPVKSTQKKTLKTALAVLLFLGILLSSVPAPEIAAAPAITHLGNVDTPIYIGYGSVVRDYLHVYIMRDPNTGNPVYCTRKGYSLPTSSYALQQSTINTD